MDASRVHPISPLLHYINFCCLVFREISLPKTLKATRGTPEAKELMLHCSAVSLPPPLFFFFLRGDGG